MGLLDFLLTDSERRRRAAIAVGRETGLVEECPICRQFTERDTPDELLYQTEKLAEEWVEKYDPRVEIYRHDAEGLKKRIRQLKKETPFDCFCSRQQ